LRRTSATGLTVSITHLILSRAPSHVFERLIVAIASTAPWRALSAGDTPGCPSAAGNIEGLGRRSVGGERVSEPVATVNRVVFVDVVTASSAGDIPAHPSAAVGIGVLVSLGGRSVGGEGVSVSVATVDRVVFMESWAIEDFVASLGGDSLTWVDWRSVVLMGKTG